MVLDRLETTRELVVGLKEAGIRVWTFDDLGPGQAHTDVAIHALLQDVQPGPNVYVGYRYLILPERDVEASTTEPVVSHVFSCFGGYDARVLRDLLLEVFEAVPMALTFDVVLGGVPGKTLEAYRDTASLLEARTGHEIRVRGRVNDLSPLLQDSDLALVSGGMIAFECARFGVPTIGLPQYEHQLANLGRLQEAGCLKTAGRGMKIDITMVVGLVTELSANPARREKMSRAGRTLFDGQGAERVVKILEDDFSGVPSRSFRNGVSA